MMTSENYSSSHRYKVDKADGRLFHKDTERSEKVGHYEDHGVGASDSTDLNNTESVQPMDRRSRGRRSKDHISADGAADQGDAEVEGATAQVSEKPKSLKKEKASGKKRKDRKNLREKRRSTGVVIMPGGAVNDEAAGGARQTMENTLQNENVGADDVSPSEVASSTPGHSSRVGHKDGDLDRKDKKELIDRIEQLEKSLDQKTKEVDSLKAENKRLHDDNNALLRVVNQVSSLKVK